MAFAVEGTPLRAISQLQGIADMTDFPIRRSVQRLALMAVPALAFAAPVHAQGFTLEEATIESLHAALAAGETTCVDVVEGYIARIEAYDDQGPSLNAILTVNPAALDIAAELDAAYAEDPEAVGPLHCVPAIIKDNYNTFDMPTSGGVSAMATSQPPEDAQAIAQMREAGAVILAKANLMELAMGGTTFSSLGGQTLNPYDLTRTPGGSSGGTGAAIAASLGILGTGSDTGQSTRSPASAQSLVGIRPTRGLLSRAGVIPLSVTQDEIGPITRTVADAAQLLQVIAGYDPADPITAASIGNIPDYLEALNPDALDGARIGLLTDVVGSEERHAEVNAVLDEAIAVMESLGAEVVEISIPDFADLTSGMGTSNAEFGAAFAAYLEALGPDAPITTAAQLVESGAFSVNADSLTSREVSEAAMQEAGYLGIFRKRDEFQKALYVVMADNELDAILYPHQSVLVAPIADGNQLERNGVISNASGFPAVTFPGGFSTPTDDAPIGVPVGLEFLGRPWSEAELIGFAYAYEQAANPRQAPESTPSL